MIRSLALRCVRVALIITSAAVLLCGLDAVSSDTTTQQQPLNARDLNVWGRFGIGTWKRARTITETVNEKGRVVDTSITETKTTLVRADSRRLALRIDVTVNVAGKRFESQPQMIECGYYGESASQPMELKSLGSAQVMIDGQQVPCQIRQVSASNGQQRQITRIYLSDDVEPFVLKRETTFYNDDNKPVRDQQTTAEVIALDLPYNVLRGIKPAAFERTIQRNPKGTNVSLDVTCVDIPGGIVARASNELDENGRLVRRSSMELIDYQIVPSDDRDDDSSSNYSNSKIMTRREVRRARHSR